MFSCITSLTISSTINKALNLRNKRYLVTQSDYDLLNYNFIAITMPVYVPLTIHVRTARLEIHYGRQLFHGVRN
jgi:hypothetical protein